MIYKNLFINLLVRLIILVCSCMLLAVLITQLKNEYYFAASAIVIFIFIQIYLLIRYLNRINHDLSIFFSSISNNEGSLIFPEDQSGTYYQLHKSLNLLINTIKNVKEENEKQRLFLKALIDQADTGIIYFNDNDEVILCNRSLMKMIGIDQIFKLSQLDHKLAGFSSVLKTLDPKIPQVYKGNVNYSPIKSELLQLSCKVSIIKQNGEKNKLVTVHNIVHELENNELESWQKLIKVLTHEITNSVTPINSLTNSLIKYFKKPGSQSLIHSNELDNVIISKTVDGLEAIKETGQGMVDFVKAFRNISTIPNPKTETFRIKEIVQHIINLYKDEYEAQKIDLSYKINPQDMEITADRSHVEMTLINLMNNAKDAFIDISKRKVFINGFINEDGLKFIQIIDNGKGIPEENIDKIFIPFYTTKNTGTGIGLSLSRQLMRLNGGRIHVSSIPSKKTIFSLEF